MPSFLVEGAIRTSVRRCHDFRRRERQIADSDNSNLETPSVIFNMPVVTINEGHSSSFEIPCRSINSRRLPPAPSHPWRKGFPQRHTPASPGQRETTTRGHFYCGEDGDISNVV